MARDAIKLKVNGKVRVEEFRAVVEAWCDLVTAIAVENGAIERVDWIISHLEAGSAIIETRGLADGPDAEKAVEASIDEYDAVAVAAQEGRLEQFREPIQRAMTDLRSVVNGRIPNIVMITPGRERVVERSLEEPGEGGGEVAHVTLRRQTRSAIKGRIRTLDDKQGTYFTLEEAYTRRTIRCYPAAEFKERLGHYWASETWVIVEGTFTRYNEKPTLIHITDIVPLEAMEPESWRQAIGSAPRNPKGSKMTSAEAVRKVRDGEK
jgi:hypothetical protein